MRFWRAEFGPKCAGEAFDKKYAYGVRYNYAKEGKRTNYTPYSCMKIIQTPVPKVGPPCFGLRCCALCKLMNRVAKGLVRTCPLMPARRSSGGLCL